MSKLIKIIQANLVFEGNVHPKDLTGDVELYVIGDVYWESSEEFAKSLKEPYIFVHKEAKKDFLALFSDIIVDNNETL